MNRRPTFRSETVINRSNSRILVTEPTVQGRQKDVNRTSTVLNSSSYKPVINRSNSRILVTEPTVQGRQKDVSRTSTVLNSSSYKPAINRSNSVGLVTEPTFQDRQKDVNQRSSPLLSSSVCETVIKSRTTLTESADTGQVEASHLPHEMSSGYEYQPVMNRSKSDNVAHFSAVQREVPLLPYAGAASKLSQSVVDKYSYSQTLTDSVRQLQLEGMTHHGLEARVVSECQLLINGGDSESDSGGEEAIRHVTWCPPAVSTTALQPVFNAKESVHKVQSPVVQKVRGNVTARPLVVATGSVYQLINRDISQCAASDCTDWVGPRKVTKRPLTVEMGSTYQLVINRNTSQCAADDCTDGEAQREVTQRPLDVARGDAYQPVVKANTGSDSECDMGRDVETETSASVCQQELFQARVFWFLYATSLMWLLLFCSVFINKLQSV
jgi:hypothetical protein